MGAAIVLGVVSLVVALIIGILSAFPLDISAGEAAIPSSNYENAHDFGVDAVEEAGERFLFGYKSLIEDLISFQRDPCLERAEARRDAFVSYADHVQQRFKGLSRELRERLDQLTASNEESGGE